MIYKNLKVWKFVWLVWRSLLILGQYRASGVCCCWVARDHPVQRRN